MRIIKPIEVTDAILLSSSVPEDDYPPWSSAESLLVGDRRIRNHRIYEALIAHSGIDPAGPDTTPATWLDVGATNRWRLFDDRVTSQTSAAGEVSVSLRPVQLFNALGLINCHGISAHVAMTDPVEGLVYQRDVSLLNYGAEDWYAYFFGPYDYIADMVLLDLPAYPNASLDVSVSSDTTASIGQLSLGKVRELGVALYGTSVGIIDYTRKDTDEFGNTVIVKRAYSKRADFDVSVETARVGFVQRALAEIRAQPVIWVGEQNTEATILFGFYRDFSISISGPSVSDATINVEGII